jgi:heat shock protein HslJ
MPLLPTPKKSVLAGLLLLLCLPACILVVEEEDDYFHRNRWRLDVIVYYGRTYTADAPYTVTFQSTGDLYGRADCNDYDGRYETPRDGSLRIQEIYSEGSACGRQSLEDSYFEVLSSAVTYRVRGDDLIITARNGDTLYFYKD